MQKIKNKVIAGTGNKPLLIDIFFEDDAKKKPVVIYAHGFNGFKDWGNFDLIAERFAAAGYVFVKFNFSHNGTTPETPEEFTDLEAFGHNNYTTELSDLQLILGWVCTTAVECYGDAIDVKKICLLGHSMGGGMVVLTAAADKRVTALITWAGITECTTPWGSWPAERRLEWKAAGVDYYTNTRTRQQMPLYYQLYEDFENHRQQLDIKAAISKLTIPVLICHGTLDTAVPFTEALELKRCLPTATLFTVESDHVFGRKHPWEEKDLPAAMKAVLDASLDFLAGAFAGADV